MKAVTEKIECLGKTFTSEEERREFFRDELRKKLPELKKIEGFPIGEDEDIINLSDPPYYTACPNPWLNDFIAEWEKEKENIKSRKRNFQVDEPYASDVSEGKYDPIYLYHPYPTKVPHKAIMKYLLHYTQPGDIIFDGFAGTGMTGVASRMCSNPDVATKLKIEKEFSEMGFNQPLWGARNSIISDLSPLASFISSSYNLPVSLADFIERAKQIIQQINAECKWMFETKHSNGGTGNINYVVWSDVFVCNQCSGEVVFWDNAVDKDAGKVLEEFSCPHCSKVLKKREIEKAWVTEYDYVLNSTIRKTKTVPVHINYSLGTKRYEKQPDKYDLELISKIKSFPNPNWFPNNLMMDKGESWGDTWRSGVHAGVTNVHHFYTDRNLFVISRFRELSPSSEFYILITKIAFQNTKLYRYTYQSGVWGAGGGPMSGTLYMPSLVKELNAIKLLESAIKDKAKITFPNKVGNCLIGVQSATKLFEFPSDSIDYIFTDPPFGANLMYSELNFIAEAWLKVKTNNKLEAIENNTQNKSTLEYQDLMSKSFAEYYRILKSGKWMTVEFSNTSAAIWNAIQSSLQKAGFIIANVAALDKQKESFKAVTSPTAVKQDLVISCYKPTIEFENTFKSNKDGVIVWDFVTEHLHHLPVHLKKDNNTAAIIERSLKILYDRLITFYLMRGLPIPIDSKDFQDGIKQRFTERDGMFFTAEQAAEYDDKKAKAPEFIQLSLIVTNEADAIEWLKERLRKSKQKYQDITNDWKVATQALRKGDLLPELNDILTESFIQDADGKWRTPNPNEAKDREALRTKVLLKEFNTYVAAISQPKAKKLKEVRVEALRAGFKNCWEQKDFKTIVSLGDMIPQNILLEDEQLLMYYDIAKDRV